MHRIAFIAIICLILGQTSCNNGEINKDKQLGLQWVSIPGGSFIMGNPDGRGESDERPQHKEQIGSLDVLKTEVTVNQFQQCVDNKVCWETLDGNHPTCNHHDVKNLADHPMNCIDWYQANVFCAWINARLPSEAEWEYIASNQGMTEIYPWGEEPVNCELAAIGTGPNQDCNKGWTSKVCSRPEGNSKSGLCDLIGNVYEWVNDWYYYDYYDHKGETPPMVLNLLTNDWDRNRVMRGGGINSDEPQRVRNRIYHGPSFQYSGLGVRCVRSIGPHINTTKRPKAVAKTILASQISTEDATGTAWNHTSNIIVPKHGLIVNFDKIVKAPFIDTSLDNNDSYIFEIYLDDELLTKFIIKPKPELTVGLAHYHQVLPSEVVTKGFNRITITPKGGDNMYSLGHISFK